MDGLLFDTEALCAKSWRIVSEQSGYVVSDELFYSCVGRNNRDTRELVLASCGTQFPYEDFNQKTRKWMNDWMSANGPPEKPGIRILFDFLKSCSIPIALATSSSEHSARWMIERAGLTSYFDAFAFGSEVSMGKPAPDIFLLAKERLGNYEAEKCVVFEDSPAGLRAAASAGMKPVFIKDLIEPQSEVLSLVWKRIPSLENAACTAFYSDIR